MRVPTGRVAVIPAWTMICAAVVLVTPSVSGQGTFTATGRMRDGRIEFTTTLLSDGRVLVTGGDVGNNSFVPRSGAEIYDPATGKWTSTTPMLAARGRHTGTLLPDGRVLVVGGWGNTTTEIYDPSTESWKSFTGPSVARSYHTATLLHDGRVLVAGTDTLLTTAQIFDPKDDTWSNAGTMSSAHAKHTATLLTDGRVLVVGGTCVAGHNACTAVDIYTPGSGAGSWSSATALTQSRAGHSATVLGDGRVLIAGGYGPGTQDMLTSTVIFDPAAGTWSDGPSLTEGRKFPTSTLLSNGRVLLAGGETGGGNDTDSVKLYDPSGGGSWSDAGTMTTQRSHHGATLLSDGRVLLLGGDGASGRQSSAEIYNPGPGTWSPATSMGVGRSSFRGVLLADGRALMIGGDFAGTAQTYSPASGTWTNVGSMNVPRNSFTATLLADGRVLVTGGTNLITFATEASAELFDPQTNTWTNTGPMPEPRQQHTATLLADGGVFVAGGLNGQFVLTGAIYNPATGQWTTKAAMPASHINHGSALLDDGRVLIAGGNGSVATELYDPATNAWSRGGSLLYQGTTLTVLPGGRVLSSGAATSEIFDPETDAWTATGSMSHARFDHTATLLADGRVLVAGGRNNGGTRYATTEIYDPATELWSSAGTMANTRSGAVAVLLPDGPVLVAGGAGTGTSAADIYTAASATTATSRCPSIPTVLCPSFPPPPAPPPPAIIDFTTRLELSGHFRADAEASGGAASQSSAANVPIVELIALQGERKITLRAVPSGPPGWRPNFFDDPMTLAVEALPALDTGLYLLAVSVSGVRSKAHIIKVVCGVKIATQPQTVPKALGQTATFSVFARGARTYQWQKDSVNIPGANGPSYTTPPIAASDAGARYRVIVTGMCSTAVETSSDAVVTVADSSPPVVNVVTPSGGEYWLLSTADKPPNTNVVAWSMSDNVRVCRVEASLRYSNDGGVSYTTVANPGGGLPATFGTGGACAFPGELTTSLTYTVPTAFPSGQSGSLYKVRIRVTDQAGNVTTADSGNPFYIVQANPDSVKTLILSNVNRMITKQGISQSQATQLRGKLQELANHPRVLGVVVDLDSVTSLAGLYAAWDADPANPTKANDVLFGANGIHSYVRTNLLAAYTGVKYLILAGDDRIIPMARIQDRTVLLPEQSYPAGGDISPTSTTVGQALAAGKYLSDDPIAVMDTVSTAHLEGSLFLPDLAVGRLVETPQQLIKTIATYISQDGILDLTLLDPTAGHKVLVTGYDFLSNVATQMRARWKAALNVTTPDASTAPVDGSLVTGTWGLGSVPARTNALRTRLGGNGGGRYAVMAIAGHATHFEEGVPGTNPLDIQGLSTADVYGADSCATPSAGALDLAGGVVYAMGCHGGLNVPGSCRTDVDRSLDLPETMLARGVVAYVANSGYGWGLRFGIGYGARLMQIFTEQITSRGTIVVGDAVRQTKQRYYLETPRYDPYDEKSVMQWTLFGLPMYAVKTGVDTLALQSSTDSLHGIRVTREPAGATGSQSRGGMRPVSDALPPSLTQLNLSFDFTADGVYRKHDSSGAELPPGPGCGDVNGCYYTLNGQVDRGTGSGDLPIQPYLIYDSRLSGTSQHGVLWKGGTYDEESGWTPVIAELVSNGGDGSNHGSTPRIGVLPPTSLRVVPGADSPQCRPSDLELNSLTIITGEAVKNQSSDLQYTIARRYRNVDLEVFYFNNQATPSQNCDRDGPALGNGPFAGRYHQMVSGVVSWEVPVTDPSGVWRVLAVYTTNTVDAQSRGVWTPVELTNDGTGTFRASLSTSAAVLTYVLQAVDNRGNVTWLNFVSAQLPSSGVPLGVPLTVDVTSSSNAPPTGVVATATAATTVSVTWSSASAPTYDVYRSASGMNFVKIGSTSATTYQDTTAAADTSYLYAVTAVDGVGNATPRSDADLATTVMFDDPGVAAGTLIRRVHITQLRTAVNAVRTLAGMGTTTFTDPTITIGATPVRAAHVGELRTNLTAARATLGLPALSYADPTLTAGSTPARATHVIELREGVQ